MVHRKTFRMQPGHAQHPQSTNLFQLLESRADWFFENGKFQEVENCVWAKSAHGQEIKLVDQKSECLCPMIMMWL
jgi:hypothetical protein